MKKLISQIDWQKTNGLIPAIVQDADTGLVLMLGYMNRKSLEKTYKTKRVWFYSRTKKRLWMKGEMSGNILKFLAAKIDCDNDALLIKAKPVGPTCHTLTQSCFKDEPNNAFAELYSVIAERQKTMPKGSYTATLFREGLNKICAKVAEESAEVLYAARKQSKKRLVEESVDLLYHLLVLLAQKKASFYILNKEIMSRQKPR